MKQAFVLLALIFSAQTADAAVYADRMFAFANQRLYVGDQLMSSNRQWVLTMQGDCNLVLTRSTGQPVWHSGTNGRGNNCMMAMQVDGNLVIYSNGQAIYNSATQGNWDAVLVLQNDGNLVMYRDHNASYPANWATGPH